MKVNLVLKMFYNVRLFQNFRFWEKLQSQDALTDYRVTGYVPAGFLRQSLLR